MFINNTAQKSKNTDIMVPHTLLTYLMLHFRFSSIFYSSQLADIFAYEVLSNKNSAETNFKLPNLKILKTNTKTHSTVVVYNVHSMYTQDRFFIFTSITGHSASSGTRLQPTSNLSSIAELFPAANWLEREASELHGINFSGKKDLRNLMLQYGDSTAPFQKSFPSIGLREMYYEPLKDTLVQNPITLQL